jgi:hypothetical protein
LEGFPRLYVKRGQTFVVYSEVIDQLAVLARAAGIAAKAAPYFHSRLQAIEHTGEREREGPVQTSIMVEFM